MMSESFEVDVLPSEKAKNYTNKMRRKGFESGLQKGHPVELGRTLANEIIQGAQASRRIITNAVTNAGGVTEWMKSHPVKFGPYELNDPDVNRQLDQRLNKGYSLPLTYDVLLVRDHGKPTVRVIELQTTTDYEASLSERFSAAGYNPQDKHTWFGKEPPSTTYSRLSNEFANGEPIVVMDTNPFDETGLDKIGMQRFVGRQNDLPISPLDILGKDEKGYYFHPYVKDSNKQYGVKRDENGDPIKDTSRIEYARNILARMGQFDLDVLWEKVKNQPEKAALIRELLTDGDINWIWHSTWKHIGDKYMLPLIREKLVAEGNPLAEHFVPVYGAGEKVIEPGEYIKKPTSAQHGVNQSVVQIDPNSNRTVENGYVYQGLIKPYPVLSYLPGKMAAPLRKENQTALRERDEKSNTPRPVTGHLEIRSILSPYGDSGRFIARYAPRSKDPDPEILDRTQTNAATITKALDKHVQGSVDKRLYPFGISPVIISDKD